jgi:molecular chaperone GrpE (heat shock protein)
MGPDKKDDLEEVRRMAEENRKSIQRMAEEIQRLKRRLESKAESSDEGLTRDEK